jgi:hypothetical protein
MESGSAEVIVSGEPHQREDHRRRRRNSEFMAMADAFFSSWQKISGPPTPMSGATSISVKSDKIVNWGDMAELDLSKPGEIDRWFVAFEGKMGSCNVDRTDWSAKFVNSSKVSAEIKNEVSTHGLRQYEEVRQWILQRHGPKFPLGYFRDRMHQVRGQSREGVRRDLEALLTLYNRAAEDHISRPTLMTQADLVYPFIRAFSVETQEYLGRQLTIASRDVDPFEVIFGHAPSKEDTERKVESTLAAAITESKVVDKTPNELKEENKSTTRRGKRSAPETALIAAIQKLTTTVAAQKAAQPGRNPCSQCGRQCLGGQNCPAFGKICNKCHRLNHFSVACRTSQKFGSENHSFRKGPQFQSKF